MFIYTFEETGIHKQPWSTLEQLPPNTLWLDLIDINFEQEAQVEKILGIDIPTPWETQDLTLSNRLYEENKAIYMSVSLFLSPDNTIQALEEYVITFILLNGILVTVHDKGYDFFRKNLDILNLKGKLQKNCAISLLLLFLNNMINDTSSILEKISSKLDKQNDSIIQDATDKSINSTYKTILGSITINENLISKIRESLVSFTRVVNFLLSNNIFTQHKNILNSLKVISIDIVALTDQAVFLSHRITFLLDATLGLINIEQNNIIKVFSIVSIIFTPPVLISAIYGMNFKIMPELNWSLGYPFSLAVMTFSSWLTYIYFKKKKWF